MIKGSKILILSVSDSYGREEITKPLGEFSDTEIHEYLYEPCSECEGEGCEECYGNGSIDLDPMLSIYSVPLKAWEERDDTGYGCAHSTHWLNKHGEELCVGDFI